MEQTQNSVHQFFIVQLRSWYELLQLLCPSELLIMGAIIAHKTLGIYQSLLAVWWLLALAALPALLIPLYGITISIISISLMVLLVARSSVPAKRGPYLLASAKTGMAIVFLLGISCAQIFLPHIPAWLFVLGIATSFVCSPIVLLLVLCVSDAYPEVRAQKDALLRAVTIFLYHYPFFIMVYLIAWYLLYPLFLLPLAWLFAKLHLASVSEVVVYLLWMPWYSAAMVYGYTRFMHEHMDYYYR